jgi:hypothetical protein
VRAAGLSEWPVFLKAAWDRFLKACAEFEKTLT